MKPRALLFDTAGADLDEVRGRTRWTMGASIAVHVLLLLIVLLKPVRGSAPELTEFTLVAPGDLDPAPAAGAASAPPRASATAPGVAVSSSSDESFRRTLPRADVAPDPQTATAVDRMTARLAAMRADVSVPVPSASSSAPSALWSTPAGAPGGTGSSGGALTLTRGGTGGSGPALSLGRGGSGELAPALAPAAVGTAEATAPAGVHDGDASARRTLAGSELAGPIADRAVLRHATPIYPEWAKRDGVEAQVTLYFIVRADGSVKENILVQKTAGFGDFDDSARAALAAWRFEPLRGGRTGEQWGTITFHFRLRDA